MSRVSIVAVAVLVLACIGGGIYYFTNVSAVPIADLLGNPRQYDGKTVTISGEVIQQSSFLMKSFRVKDATGEVDVVTTRFLPKVGEKVRVKGRLKEPIAIGDVKMQYFEEMSGE